MNKFSKIKIYWQTCVATAFYLHRDNWLIWGFWLLLKLGILSSCQQQYKDCQNCSSNSALMFLMEVSLLSAAKALLQLFCH